MIPHSLLPLSIRKAMADARLVRMNQRPMTTEEALAQYRRHHGIPDPHAPVQQSGNVTITRSGKTIYEHS